MSDWLESLAHAGDDPRVLVTVARVEGSAPREAGAKMIVSAHGQSGSVGGGHLELKAVELARELLEKNAAKPAHYRFPLGPSLGQCCGGAASLVLERIDSPQPAWIAELAAAVRAGKASLLVTRVGETSGRRLYSLDAGGCQPVLPADLQAGARVLIEGSEAAVLVQVETGLVLLERIAPPEMHVVLFGAGHVGRAMVSVLCALPCRITWVDSRDAEFPAEVPANVTIEVSEAPAEEVAGAPAGSCFLVMTHSHALDQDICERILRRGDFRYFGLIGSSTKRATFERRLRERGIAADQLARMVCPIGIAGIDGKHPGAIAVAVAAQLLQIYQSHHAAARV